MIKVFFLLIRPWQWTKNLFIFLPLFFFLQIHHPFILAKAGLAFILFCMLTGGIYILNDYFDVDDDRLHPKKKMRPLAAGLISGQKALFLCAALSASALLGSWFLSFFMFLFGLAYMGINILYTIKLKHIPIIDIFIIGSGFVTRIFIGGVVTGVKIYPWIVVMTFLLALFLALGKRRDDVLSFIDSCEKPRESIDGYTLIFIDSCMMALASVTIVSYLMYTMSYEIITKFKTNHLYLSTVFVVLGIMRYLQITMVEKRSGSPTEILLKDLFIQVSIIGWIVTFGVLIYLQ